MNDIALSKDKLYQVSRAHQRYKTADGMIVPSVTTALYILNKPQLVSWANKLGLEGIDSNEYTKAAARIGTLVHAMIEAYLLNNEIDLADYSENEIDQAQTGYVKFIEWKKEHEFNLVHAEQQFVSEEHKYGGTIDCLAYIDGALTLLDFKTGKAIYDEYFYQLSAYEGLLKENGFSVANVTILRIGRDEEEGFETRTLKANSSKLKNDFEIFKSCLHIYNLKKTKYTEKEI